MDTNDVVGQLDQLIVERVEAKKVTIPPFPAVAVRLNQVIGQDDFSMRELVDIVSQDQVLAASVVRYAKAAARGGGQNVTSLQVAVSRLGAKELSKLALTLSLGTQVTKQSPLLELKLEAWRRAVLAAELCRILARDHSLDAGQAYLAGLLHDFGFMVAYAALEAALRDRGKVVCLSQSQWRDLANRHHTGLGLMVAKQWQLPEALHETIGDHHRPAVVESSPLLRLVVATDRIAELVEANPQVTAQHIAEVPYLASDSARRLVAESLAELPAIVFAASPEPPLPKTAPPIERPESTFVGQRFPVDLDVELKSVSSPQLMKARVINYAGLGLHSRNPLPTNSLARFVVVSDGKPLELWSSVSLCVEESSAAHYIEVKPMALKGDTAARWNSMLDGAQSTSA